MQTLGGGIRETEDMNYIISNWSRRSRVWLDIDDLISRTD